MKILYCTDMHGDRKKYERVLREVRKDSIDALLIGGDLAPTGLMSSFASVQREFIKRFLVPRLKKLRAETEKNAYLIMGNDDFRRNLDLLEKADQKGYLGLLDGRIHKLRERKITGYSFVNPTPFRLKDWEKTEEEIREDLKEIRGKSRPGKTIYVFHAPPFGTKLDVLHNGTNAGSVSIREFINREQPPLTLHGHIHESFRITGLFAEKIEKTLSVNPGDKGFTLIDLNKMNAEFVTY